MKEDKIMPKRNKKELTQIIKDTLAVQDVRILQLKIKYDDDYQVMVVTDLFANLKRDNIDVVQMEFNLTASDVNSKQIATIITRAFLSNLRILDEQFNMAESDDLIIDACHKDLDEVFRAQKYDYANTFIIKSCLDSREDFLSNLHDLMFNVGQDLFLEKIDQPSLLDENMPLPDLSSKIMALEFSKFVKNQWLLDSNSIVPDAEHAALKINNYNLFVQYLYEDNEVKYTKQDLMKLQDMVLRGFRIKG